MISCKHYCPRLSFVRSRFISPFHPVRTIPDLETSRWDGTVDIINDRINGGVTVETNAVTVEINTVTVDKINAVTVEINGPISSGKAGK